MLFDDKLHEYYFEGIRIPSVTEIIKPQNDRLMQWAVNRGVGFVRDWLSEYEPEVLGKMVGESVIEDAVRTHSKMRQDAADVGKKFHSWVESHVGSLMGFEAESVEESQDIQHLVRAYKRWESEIGTSLEYVAAERRILSVKHGYAGTLDILAKIDNELWLLDVKTSKKLYPEFRMQTAAYAKAFEEETGVPIAKRAVILVPKHMKRPLVSFVPFEDDDATISDFDAFLSCLTLYHWRNIMKELEES